jgi:CheY-like chemotaxis protein
LKGKRQPLAREGGPDLRTEVNEQVYRLNKAVARLRANIRNMEILLDDRHGVQPEFARLLAENNREIDAFYRTMVRLRWAALRVRPAPESDRLSHQETWGSPAKDHGEPTPTMFVVDRDPSVRMALSRLFRSVGYRVDTFASARLLVEAEPGARPACLVQNVHMPRMEGIDLHREIRETGTDLPVVFITDQEDVELAVRAIRGGAIDFLAKPIDDQDLLDAVERALCSRPPWNQRSFPGPGDET